MHLTLDDGAFIVGGQALNLWAERYSAAPELAAYGPYTSKDIDYFGRRKAAEKLAQALGGRLEIPEIGDATPQSAKVIAEIAGQVIEIDFLDYVLGVRPDSLERQAVEIVLPVQTADGTGELPIPVMHPLHCLQSRVANVIKLERREDTAIRQLSAAPIVLREYISELLAIGETREATATLQALFEYLRSDINGRDAHRHGDRDPLEVLAAFREDARLDPRYRERNLAEMISAIEGRRKKAWTFFGLFGRRGTAPKR